MLHYFSAVLAACVVFNCSFTSGFFLITANNHYCINECLKYEEEYYWCNWGDKKWDYCSPFKDTTYKGVPCRDNDICSMHSNDYYWCYTDSDNNWDYCGVTVDADIWKYVLSDTYHAMCVDDCGYHGSSYLWCYTLKGWDYCSPANTVQFQELSIAKEGERCLADCRQYSDYYYCDVAFVWEWQYCSPWAFATIWGKECRLDHPCDRYGQKYYWCYTDSSNNWDYCSPQIDCAYWPTDAFDRSTGEVSGLAKLGTDCVYRAGAVNGSRSEDSELVNVNVGTPYCNIPDYGNHRQFTFQEETNNNLLVPNRNHVAAIRNAIGTLDINGINDNQHAGTLVDVGGVRIDFQGFTTGRAYANIQVQLNVPRRPGESTTVALLLIPVGVEITPRYIRSALNHSLDTRTSVTIVHSTC